MSAIAEKFGGTIDKFIGDGLMAFFGAPNSVPNTSSASIRAAQEMEDTGERRCPAKRFEQRHSIGSALLLEQELSETRIGGPSLTQ